MTGNSAAPMAFGPRGPLGGGVRIPGDKSISHRALMLAALSVGHSRIDGLCDGSDVFSTAAALRAMGAAIASESEGGWCVDGVGVGGLLQPAQPFDMGNSGTSARLLMGIVATHPIAARFVGDASLSRRPMNRVIAPLRRLGAEIEVASGEQLPLTVRGIASAAPLTHRLTVASAQVKSALLFAALNTPGISRVIEPIPTRDHSERMLRLFGADIAIERGAETVIALRGEAELRPQHIIIPADPSAAAFLVVAALIVPGSDIRLEGVGVNPMRTGLFTILQAMGADLNFYNRREVSGEPVADLTVRHSSLRGADVPLALVPAMIDEFPIFFIAAAFAEGISRARGLSELRVKESDRIGAMARGLAVIGAEVREEKDGLVIHGSGGGPLPGGATVASAGDHRVAMSCAVAGLACRQPVTVDDMTPVATSFPGFAAALDSVSRP